MIYQTINSADTQILILPAPLPPQKKKRFILEFNKPQGGRPNKTNFSAQLVKQDQEKMHASEPPAARPKKQVLEQRANNKLCTDLLFFYFRIESNPTRLRFSRKPVRIYGRPNEWRCNWEPAWLDDRPRHTNNNRKSAVTDGG